MTSKEVMTYLLRQILLKTLYNEFLDFYIILKMNKSLSLIKIQSDQSIFDLVNEFDD